MNYYERLNRHDAGFAAAVFGQIWSDKRTRHAGAVFLSEIIARASERTTAWSITLDPGSIRVNVGPVQLASFSPQNVWLCVGDVMDDAMPAWIETTTRRRIVYPSVPVRSRGLSLPPMNIGKLSLAIRKALHEYVDEAAMRRRGKSSWIRAHSPGIIRFLETYLDIRLSQPEGASLFVEAESESTDGRMFVEGRPYEVCRGLFERNRAARDACVRSHGYRCSVCDTTLAELYGSIAANFIHVHHLTPMSERRKEYEIDPIRDLRPICPTCHAIIHLRTPPLSIARARSLIASVRKGTGATIG